MTNPPTPTKSPIIPLIVVAYLSFIALGAGDGLLGVAWPSMRRSFGLPLDAIGLLLMATTAGYMLSSAIDNRLVSRFGAGLPLLGGVALRALGQAGYALVPGWLGLLVCGAGLGIGTGIIDAGLNAFVATRYKASAMNWLHASYGIGATLGPLMMTRILATGQSWRLGYAVAAALSMLIALCHALTLPAWQSDSKLAQTGGSSALFRSASYSATLRLPIVWLGMSLFIVYVGVEISAGQWAFSLFTEARSISIETAGVWVGAYWGVFTAGRVLFGFIADRVEVKQLLRSVMLGSIAGAGLLWWNPLPALGFLGLALLGFSLAPIYASLMSETSGRIGSLYAGNAIGFQVAAAGLGSMALPALAGVLAQHVGLETLGIFLTCACGVLFALHEITIKMRNV